MLPARLLLVRHGQTDWNLQRRVQGQTDIPLNETGRRQARLLAERLRDFEVDALVASDLERAAETARIVGAALGLEPRLGPEWRELHFGGMEGDDGQRATQLYGELVSAVARAGGPLAEGGESFDDLQRRLLAGFETICRDHAGGNVLVVGHGGALKTLIAHLIGLEPARIDRLSLRTNSSLSIIDFRHGRPQLTLLNCARHLE